MHLKVTQAEAETLERLISNPVFDKVIEGIKADIYRRFATSQRDQTAIREALYYELSAINELNTKFRAVLTDHKL